MKSLFELVKVKQETLLNGITKIASYCCCLVAQLCPTLCHPTDCKAPLSIGFPRQEYCSGLPFPSPGIEPMSLVSPALACGFFTTESPRMLSCLFSSVQFSSLSRVRLLATPWTAARQTSLSITNTQSLLKLMSIESVMPSNHLILCRLLLLLPSIFPSIRVFFNESGFHIRWPKYCSFSYTSVLPKNIQGWFPLGLIGLISLLSKNSQDYLLQHRSSKASILQCSAFFMVQLSHPHMTTGKTIALTRWTSVAKVMSLLFSMLSNLIG